MAFRKTKRSIKRVRKSAKRTRHTRKMHLGGNKWQCPHGKHEYVCKICRKKHFETL
jgi:ribosomal protein L32E